MAPADGVSYGSDVFAIPQSTVFFRRRVLERCGGINSSFRHIYDYELLRRVLAQAKSKKIERIQAFVRDESEVYYRRSNEALVELYRLSRRQWPSLLTIRFLKTLREFLLGYMRRKHLAGSRQPRFWGMAARGGHCRDVAVGKPGALVERAIFDVCGRSDAVSSAASAFRLEAGFHRFAVDAFGREKPVSSIEQEAAVSIRSSKRNHSGSGGTRVGRAIAGHRHGRSLLLGRRTASRPGGCRSHAHDHRGGSAGPRQPSVPGDGRARAAIWLTGCGAGTFPWSGRIFRSGSPSNCRTSTAIFAALSR